MFQKTRPFVAAIGIAIFLASCADDSAFIEGRAMVARGDGEAGIRKFQEALRTEPNNAEYRAALVQARERTIAGYHQNADAALAQGDAALADTWYRRVLAIDASDARALAGLAKIQRDRRLAELQKDAAAAAKAGDNAAAQRALREILTEAPQNAAALELQRAIEARTARLPVETLLAASLKKPITIEFKDTTLKQVFEVLAHTSGLNFLFDKDVRGDQKTTVFLRNTTIDSAVNMVLLTNQLEQRVLDANSILIYPNNAAKARDYQPLVVKTFIFANADAKLVANTIKTIVKTKDVVVDEKQNMVIMRDTPEAIRLAEKLAAMHDLPEPEVMLDVEVLEVNRNRISNLGIQWPDQLALSPLPSNAGGAVTLSDLRHLGSGGISAALTPLTINAKRENSDANILANPRIRSRNKEKAKILVGDRVPNITTTTTSTGFVAESVQYIDVGLKLEVEPTIYADDEIAIKIAMEVSTIANQVTTKSGALAYQIGTRNANTVIRLKDGENQILAGLISDEDRRIINRVPGLGSLPVLGHLFGDHSDTTNKTEIVLSITPHLIRNIRRPDLASSEFESGTEASLRSRAIETLAPAPGVANPVPVVSAGAAPAVFSGPGVVVPAGASPPNGAEGAAAAPAPSPSAPLAAVGPTSVTWQAPATATVGSTFSMTLSMRAGEPVTSVPLAIGYDAQALEIVDVTEGDLLRQGSATNFSSRVNKMAGQLFATVVRSAPQGVTGQGSLVTVTFRAIGPAPAALAQVLAISPTGAGGKAVAVAMPVPQSISIGKP
ncbi:MAG: ral secretion pathway protein GspD [Betaproteobacteria bacterium]|nr:ral secretion pathway protein GspD [Betaproteobacteria bacterium]